MEEHAKQRIKEIVAKLKEGRTQGEVALQLGVSPGTIRNWVGGISYPDLDGLIAISGALGISLVQLLGEILGTQIDKHPVPETAEQVLLQAKTLSNKEKIRLIALLAQDALED